MSSLPSSVPGVLGNTSLSQFDVIIIGSGAGGSMAARTLTVVGGKKVRWCGAATRTRATTRS